MKPDWTAQLPRPHNPPGRSAIDYRVTTHGASLQRMLARLAPHMAGLSERQRDDPSVALLDAAAVVADVLTFYQERIANEGYLQTATERLSVVELARHVYELDYGVAAATHVAFTVEDDAGEIEIPEGTQLMSVPVPGTEPQVFETSETLVGRPEWNAIPLAPAGPLPPRRAPTFAASATELRIAGVESRLKPGSWILVKAASSSAFRLLQVAEAAPAASGEWTTITWATSLPAAAEAGDLLDPEILWLQQALPLRGYNLSLLGQEDVARELEGMKQALGVGVTEGVTSLPGDAERAWEHARALSELSAGRFPSVQAQISDLLVAVHGYVQDPSQKDAAALAVTQLSEHLDAYAGLPHFRVHEAPDVRSIDLAVEARGLLPDAWLVLVDVGRAARGALLRRAVQVVPSAPQGRFGLLARTTRIELDAAVGPQWDLRETLVLAGPQRLMPFGDPPAPPGADIAEPAPTADGLRQLVAVGLPVDGVVALAGRKVAISGLSAGRPFAEIATVAAVDGGVITLEASLRSAFDADSMFANANVAEASHGETVVQHLGSGDATQAGQRFTLVRSPLSFAPSPSGPQPQLRVYVNGVEWQRVHSLDEVDGDFPGYMIRIRDDGATTVLFGDGVNGARLPTGLHSVVARYRVGLGVAGNLAPERLKVLTDPPPGVVAALNPVAASGGRGPDTLEQAKARSVFATRVAGGPITRSELEDAVWATGEVGRVVLRLLAVPAVSQLVQITIAGKDRTSPASAVVSADFCAALERELTRIAPSPGRRFRVQSFATHDVSIVILRGSLEIASGVTQAEVSERMVAVLSQHTDFAQGEFGQTLSVSQVDSWLRDVPGLTAFDLVLRDRHGESVDAVSARGAHVGFGGAVVPAELLSVAVTFSDERRS